jgi:hypothetical protein
MKTTIKKKTRRFDLDIRIKGTDEVAHTLEFEIVPNGARRAQPKNSKIVRMTRGQTALMLRNWRAKGRPHQEDSTTSLAAAIKMVIWETLWKPSKGNRVGAEG